MNKNKDSNNRIIVATYDKKYNKKLGLNFPVGSIWLYKGLSKHVKKRHPNCLKYIDYIGGIISSPDYIGHNSSHDVSVEFIKKIDENILVAVKMDVDNGYLYVASLYSITENKLKKKLANGRLKKL